MRYDRRVDAKFVRAFMSPDEAFVVQLLKALETAGLEGVIVGMTAAALQTLRVRDALRESK